MMRCLFRVFALLLLSATLLLANLAPPPNPTPIIIPHVPKDSPVPTIIAGVAVTVAIFLFGLWIANRRRSGKSQNQ